MNVIGHMACAEHLGADAELGAMLPDLLSLFDRRIRPIRLVRGDGARDGGAPGGATRAADDPRTGDGEESPAAPEGTRLDPEGGSLARLGPVPGISGNRSGAGRAQSVDSGSAAAHGSLQGGLHAGVRFHFHVDSAFHRSDLFRDCAGLLRERLNGASRAPGLKRFAAAHILTELYLDHLLLAERPERLERFYAALSPPRIAPLRELLARHPEVDRAGFVAFLGELVRRRFADEYLEPAALVRRLERILPRLRQRNLLPEERAAALDGLSGHRGAVSVQLSRFLDDMRSWTGAAPELPAGGVDSGTAPGIE